MEVSSLINNTAQAYSASNTNVPKTASEKAQMKSSTLASENVDKFDNSTANFNRNFNQGTNRADFLNIQGHRGQSVIQMKNAIVADFVNFNIRNQLGRDFAMNLINGIFKPSEFAVGAFNAAEATSSKHEDYWGVEAVAERIFTFAKSLAGDNDGMFQTMKNAFLKGFNLASGAAKGKLPDISHQTKARVLEMFDGWEAEIAARKNPAPAEDK
jgi:hypothetical protein